MAILCNPENFCDSIAIVGLREIYHRTRSVTRLIWATCLLGGLFLTCFFMGSIVWDYHKNPSLTKVYNDVSEMYDFPQTYVTIDASIYIYQTLSQMGLSKEGIDYIESLYVFSEKFKPNATSYQNGKQSVNEFAYRYNITHKSDLFELATVLLPTYFNINLISGGVPNESPSKVPMFRSTLSYEIPFEDGTHLNRIGAGTNTYKMEITNISQEQNFAFYLTSGRYYQRLVRNDFIPLPIANRITIVIANAVKFKRLNVGKIGCTGPNGNAEQLYSTCETECYSNLINDCANCTLADFREQDIFSEFCTHLKDDMKQCDPKSAAFSICLTRCPPMCDEYVYQLTTRNEPISDANKIEIEISLLFTENGILTYEEISSYSFVTAVSNVGGQLGLWLGLSAATIVQIVMFFFEQCFCGRQQIKVPRVIQVEGKI